MPVKIVVKDAAIGLRVVEDTVFRGPTNDAGAMSQPLTERFVLAIALAAFGVIIAVNLVLSYPAIGALPGMVVPNAYFASQSFDADRRAQAALGWTLALAHEDGVLSLHLADASGLPVRPASLAVVLGHPTTAQSDRTLALTPTGYEAAAPRSSPQ